MSETVAQARPDTSDMLAVHQVFRDALDAASDLVADAVVEHPDKAEVVAAYYGNVLAFLLVHHAAEDELLWPKLLERCHEEALRVVVVAEQHDGVAEVLEHALDAVTAFGHEPSAEHGARLVGALSTLRFELSSHLTDTEQDILPLAAEHLTPKEWAELPQHALTHFQGDRMWLILGLVLDAETDSQRDALLGHLPEQTREQWEHEGRPQYEELMAALRA